MSLPGAEAVFPCTYGKLDRPEKIEHSERYGGR